MNKRRWTRGLLALLLVPAFAAVPEAGANHGAFSVGDVFVGVGRNTVQWRHPDGSLNRSLTTAASSPQTTGMAFDAGDRLFVTGYTSNVINTFGPDGTAGPTLSSGFNSHPESIAFDTFGNAYVGQEGGSRDILEFDPAGNPIDSLDAVPGGKKGTDRLDVASDQCTIYYTSQAKAVKRFDACSKTQLTDFASNLPGKEAYDVKILLGGGALVADTQTIVRLDASGAVTQSFDQPGENCWTALSLDTVIGSFWAGDGCSSNVYRFDLGTGQVLASFNAGPRTDVQGLAVNGGLTAATAADVSVAVTDTPDPVSPSLPDPSYTLHEATVANAGPGMARDVTLTSQVTGGTIESASGSGWTCTSGATTATCTLDADLGIGAVAAPVGILIRSPETSPDTISNEVAVAANEADPDPSNNSESETTAVENNADVGVTHCPNGCTASTTPNVDNTWSRGTVPPMSPPAAPGAAIASNGGATGGSTLSLSEGAQTFVCGDPDNTQELLFLPPDGYTDPFNPVLIEMNFLLAGSGLQGQSGQLCILKEGSVTPQFIPPCPTPGVAIPSPCETERFVSGGVLTIRFVILSGDPRGHN